MILQQCIQDSILEQYVLESAREQDILDLIIRNETGRTSLQQILIATELIIENEEMAEV